MYCYSCGSSALLTLSFVFNSRCCALLFLFFRKVKIAELPWQKKKRYKNSREREIRAFVLREPLRVVERANSAHNSTEALQPCDPLFDTPKALSRVALTPLSTRPFQVRCCLLQTKKKPSVLSSVLPSFVCEQRELLSAARASAACRCAVHQELVFDTLYRSSLFCPTHRKTGTSASCSHPLGEVCAADGSRG